MKKAITIAISFFFIAACVSSCNKADLPTTNTISNNSTLVDSFAATKAAFGTNIDFQNLNNYANQIRPTYITLDNSGANPITNQKATLGRVLFYDKNLSINNTISCGSCHKQNFAFSDTAELSSGVEGGVTIRHSMRLINTRFSNETKFFWNERAASLEIQTTMPIQDHAEMGFSGLNGRGNLSTLWARLSGIKYYKEIFKAVYGDTVVTEPRIQESLAQFIRSIQSFDSKFDVGRAAVNNERDPFPNFTAQENIGKNLYLTAPSFDGIGNRIGGGIGCNGCHKAPEFDIDPNSRNNGVVGVVGGTSIETNNTRAPSLRDLVKADGSLNSKMMHTGKFLSLEAVLGHYNNIPNIVANNNLDNRLRQDGIGNKLNLTSTEIAQVVAFIKTLGGTNVYTDRKWSNPFLNP
ncbi:MAG: Cytochrome peroxidase precursor [Bacteroidota bacterium]